MAVFKEVSSIHDLEEVLEQSYSRTILIFKHSTRCPVSAQAWEEVQDFIHESSEEILVVMIKVIESRPVSNQVAEELGIRHQSPQVLLLSNRRIIWHASHQAVTLNNIKKALAGDISAFNLSL